ncbi:MAG TPA: FHA domain-containing protein [Anaerolineales bacterium]|nr:FHA domain-containing protein [Anaerolineales bacterium]
MNRSLWGGRRRAVLRGILFVLVLMASPASAQPAHSQAEVASVAITRVTPDEFPAVQLQLRILDASGLPVEVIAASQLSVVEDNVALPVESVTPVDVGVRLAFVIDPGDGIRNTGQSLANVVNMARGYLRTYLLGRPWMMAGVDETLVLIQEGSNTNLLAPLTSDPAAITEELLAYTPPSDSGFLRAPKAGTYTRLGLMRALDELEFSGGGQDKPGAIVLLTPGIRADLSDVAQRAIDAKIPIHVIIARPSGTNFWEEALRPLALVTGGEFLATYRDLDIESFFNDLTSQRVQQLARYRSPSAAAGMRQVAIQVKTDGEPLTAQAQYSVELLAPQVEIAYPGYGTLVSRIGEKDPATPEEADPTFVTVIAKVTWPDGHSRGIRQAQLLVDNVPVTQVPVTEGRTEINWDIRSYQERGQVPVLLRVIVQDELGLRGESDPVMISIEYVPPPGFNLNESTLLYVAVGTAAIALILAGVLFINRARFGPAFQRAGESVVDFVERVTGRRTSLVARAFLVPLEGFEETPPRSFELYGTTSIGRSRRHADLLFHINDEDSAISRLHCTILDEDDHFMIRDEDSTNGTFVNGEKLTPLEPMTLYDGDTIDIAPLERGGIRVMFQLAGIDGAQPATDDEVRQTRPRRLSESEK